MSPTNSMRSGFDPLRFQRVHGVFCRRKVKGRHSRYERAIHLLGNPHVSRSQAAAEVYDGDLKLGRSDGRSE